MGLRKIYRQLSIIANLTHYVDSESTITNIRNSIYFRGPTVWILAFAVVVASVGLNVNSIPVIIGAMLISPLMGPITGAGLALGTNDSLLLKESFKNLMVMVIVGLLASTLYFLITPLSLDEPTELLARTRPTVYDVLIAFFGGLAGIVENAKKEKGTVIAGVAIATALMPPLCTAGFGIASLNFYYFAGAMYLFIINSIFIALATFLIVRYLNFPFVKFADPSKQKRVNRTIYLFVILIIIPSINTAIVVIRENTFNKSVKRFVTENKTFDKCYIYDYSINHSSNPSTVTLSIAGKNVTPVQQELLLRSFEKYGLSRNQLIINQSNLSAQYPGTEENIIKDLMLRTEDEIRERERVIAKKDSVINLFKSMEIPYGQLGSEIKAQYPDIKYLAITRGSEIPESDKSGDPKIFVMIEWKTADQKINSANAKKLATWLKVRMKEKNIKVITLR